MCIRVTEFTWGPPRAPTPFSSNLEKIFPEIDPTRNGTSDLLIYTNYILLCQTLVPSSVSFTLQK